MGQVSSSPELPPEWLEILATLSEDQIILFSQRRCRIIDGRVHLNDSFFDLDEHVPLALEILRVHPQLKDVRFKLVPGRMLEERFWAAIFGLLNDEGVDIDEVLGEIQTEDDYETGDETPGSLNSHPQVLSPACETHVHPNVTSIVINTPPFYLREIQGQSELIASLQKSLREANHKIRKLGIELHKERKKRHEEVEPANGDDHSATTRTAHLGHPSQCPRCNSRLESNSQHRGRWELHPDCIEFLKLDAHLKENLRKEKEKRLNEVLAQMKFILDSEDLKDTYGSWSCCGKEEYGADGCVE